MSRHLAKEDGLFLGSSSAVNLVASVRLAKKLGPGARIVTILWFVSLCCGTFDFLPTRCTFSDSGTRHYSRFW